jgi:hypothetical protein
MRIFFLLSALLSFSVHAQFTCTTELYSYEDCLESSSETQCQNQAIKSYTSYLYGSINNTLRGFLEFPECVSLSEVITQGLNKLPSVENTFYRGTRPFPDLTKLAIGDCFADKGYMSTSADIWVARGFGAEVLKIEAKAAKSVSQFSWSPGEQEYLILPNTKLKLLEKKAESAHRNFYHFREVDESECPSR